MVVAGTHPTVDSPAGRTPAGNPEARQPAARPEEADHIREEVDHSRAAVERQGPGAVVHPALREVVDHSRAAVERPVNPEAVGRLPGGQPAGKDRQEEKMS